MRSRVFLLATTALTGCTTVYIDGPVIDSEVSVSTSASMEKGDRPKLRDRLKGKIGPPD